MRIRKLLFTAAAAAILTATGAGMAQAAPYHGHGHGYGHGPAVHHRHAVHHDRYWRHGYRGYVRHHVVFRGLRAHRYYRFVGDPYWYQGRYVVRTYDRFGRVVVVEVNPYTGAYIGLIRF